MSDTELSPSLVVASRGVLKADKVTRVLSRYREGRQDYLFARLPLQELQGKTAFDIWMAGQGRFYVYSCLAHGPPADKMLRLNLESVGAWPEAGAPHDKLINVVSQKMWPLELTL